MSNATSKLNIFGRYSHLDFWTFNETVFGDVLQGRPVCCASPGNPGTGQGYTANFSAGGTYVFSTALVADAHALAGDLRRAALQRIEVGHVQLPRRAVLAQDARHRHRITAGAQRRNDRPVRLAIAAHRPHHLALQQVDDGNQVQFGSHWEVMGNVPGKWMMK